MLIKFKKIIIPIVCLVVIGVSLTFFPVIASTCSEIGGVCEPTVTLCSNLSPLGTYHDANDGVCLNGQHCCSTKTVAGTPPVPGTSGTPPVPGPAAPSQAVSLDNPLGVGVTDPSVLVGRIIFAILGLTGAIALVMFIWGGLQWMTAAGNAEKVTKGRDTLLWAVLGLVIIFSSYAILKAVLGVLAKQ